MQSIETSKGEPTGNAKPSGSKAYGIGMIAFAVFNLLGLVGILLGYFLFMDIADTSLSEATKICDLNADAIDLMEDVPQQLVESWAYNITNPAEYLDGGDAHVHEMGVYSWSFLPKIENIQVDTTTMEFDFYNQDVQFDKEKSCDTCEFTDSVYSQFTPYIGLLGAAKSEAVVMLALTCSQTQIALIATTATSALIDYCTTAEMKTATVCRCCATSPTVNATTCSTIASPSSRSGGLLSWVAKYDGGYQLSSTGNANFPLSPGDYSGLIRETNVKELVLGYPTTLVGFFLTNKALLAGDAATVAKNAQTTRDMKDACTPLEYLESCPTMDQLVQQIFAAPANTIPIIKSIDCSGIIPSAAVLEETYNLNHTRAQELRYLEGVNCRPYGLTLAISTLIRAQTLSGAGATHTCADGTDTIPCCMSAFSAPALGGAGASIGCLGFAAGLIQSRNLYSVDEANLNILPAPHAKSYTSCAEDSLRFRQEMWHGRSEWNSWFTPDTYVYPDMSWADPTVVTGAMSGAVAGNYTVYDIEGTQSALREGRGITTAFLDYDITDGEPRNKQESIFAPFRLEALEFEHVESFKYQELQVAYMKPIIQTNFTDAEHEARQRKGEMPYPNQKNVAHIKGFPLVLGYPNFYKVNEEVLSQSSNAARFQPAPNVNSAEIQLFRTRAGYHADSALLATPERVTTDTLTTFGDDYEGDLVIEPGSGVTLDASVVTMISNYIWQCDPRLDETCKFAFTAYNAADPLCYVFGNGLQMPCSVANVYTPKVHGGKVMPVLWIRSLAVTSDDLVDTLLDVSDTRYALSISVIILPIIFFIGFVFAVFQIKSVYYPTTNGGLQKQNSDINDAM